MTYKDVMRAFLLGGAEEVKRLGASKESILRATRELKIRGLDIRPLEEITRQRVRGRLRTDDGRLLVTRKVQQPKGAKPFLYLGLMEEAGFAGGEELLITVENGRIVVERLGGDQCASSSTHPQDSGPE